MGLLGDFDGNGTGLLTPEIQGLLSATFGGMAGARRGAPWNTAGIAGLSGLNGYTNALNNQIDQQQKQLNQRRGRFELDMAQQEAGVSPTISQSPTIPNTKKGNSSVNDVVIPYISGQSTDTQQSSDPISIGQMSVPTQPASWYGEGVRTPTQSQPQTQSTFDPAASMRRINAMSWLNPGIANSMRDNLKFRMEGVKLSQGDTNVLPDGRVISTPKLDNGQTWDPQTGDVSTAKGYLPSIKEITGTIEGAKAKSQADNTTAPYDMWPEINGRKVPVTMGWLQANQPSRQVQAQNAGPTTFYGEDVLNQLPPQTKMALIKRNADNGKFSVNLALPNGNWVRGNVDLKAPFAPQASTGSYVQQNISSNSPMWPTEDQRRERQGAIDTRIQAGQKLNDNWITATYNPVVQAADSSRSMLASLDALKNIDIKTGWATQAKVDAANVLTSLGIDLPPTVAT